MTIRVTSNKPGTSAQLHADASGSIVVAGNSTVSAIATSGEILTGAAITQIFYGSDAGHIKISRGANTIAILTGTGHVDYAAAGMSTNINQTANVDITLVDTANGYVLIELQKIGANLNANSVYFQV